MIKKRLIAAVAALLLLPSFVPANGLSLNGLGTRAQGMGGAFVSVANDFSAVFWNPAGAAGFRQPTFGFYASDLMPRVTYQTGLIDAKTKISHYLNFFAGAYKPVGSKVVLGIGIGMPTAQGVMWNGADFVAFTNGVVYDWSTRIYRFSFSPMAAVKISEAVSLGAALNIDYGNWSLKEPGGPAENPFIDLGQYDEVANGWGIGATFGLLVRPSDRFALGLTVRTPSTIDFDGTASLSNLTPYGFPGSSGLERKITWPLWIGGGVSFRPIERLLLSADLQWTRWSKLDRIETSFAEPAWVPFLANIGHIRVLDWRDALQFRVGGEFLLNPTTALRAGYYGDPGPGRDAAPDLLLPTFTGNAFTVGLGKTFGDLQLDFCLEYLEGHERRFDTPIMTTNVFTMHAVVPSVSASYRF